MAYPNNYNNKTQQRQNDPTMEYNAEWASQTIEKRDLPADYVDEAERVIRRLKGNRSVISITKLRNLFSMASEISSIEKLKSGDVLSEEGYAQMLMMRIRMVYEAGREESVKTFLREAKLLEYLKGVGNNRKKMLNYTQYMEALVAYYRFLIGGKEK